MKLHPLQLPILCLILIATATLNGCSFSNAGEIKQVKDVTIEPMSTATIILPTPEYVPEYLLDIQPAPSNRVPLELYQKDEKDKFYEGNRDVENWGHRSNVCVYLDVGPIIQLGENLVKGNQLVARSKLFINDIELDAKPDPGFLRPDILYGLEIDGSDKEAKYGAPYWLCWPADLPIGIHQARFEFEQQTGFVYDYEWQFELTAE